MLLKLIQIASIERIFPRLIICNTTVYHMSALPSDDLARARHSRTGFTLMELLVVITIIAVLASLLLPAVNLVRSAAKQMRCLDLVRQLQLANIAYATDNEGAYVNINGGGTGAGWSNNPQFLELLGRTSASWAGALLCPESYTVKARTNLVNQCFGANVGGVNITISPLPAIGFHTSRVPRPSDKLAWADAWDFWINDLWCQKFDVERKISNSSPAYIDSMATAFRHRGKVSAVFYDGHAEARQRDAIDPSRTSGAAKAALLSTTWYVTNP